MGKIKEGKLIYHLTKIENLDSILENGLLCRSLVSSDLFNVNFFDDVADSTIIEKRNKLRDYVPFHFHPYSSFDNAVKHEHGAENFVYITILRKRARDLNFNILPCHPLSLGSYDEIYNYDEGISCIDWKAMETPLNGLDEKKTKYVRQVKMAECLAYGRVSVEDFYFIYCHESKLPDLRKKYGSRFKFTRGHWFS